MSYLPKRSYPAYPQSGRLRRPYPVAALPRRNAFPAWGLWLAAAAALLALFLLPFAIVLGGWAYFQAFDLILPGVRVGDTALGGLNVYDAAVRLNRDWNMERQILAGAFVSGQVQTWRLLPGDLGLSVDTLETARRAHAIGRGPAGLTDLEAIRASLFEGAVVAPVVEFDPQAAYRGLQSVSNQVNAPAQDASLRIENGQVVVIPAAPGQSIDIQAALAVLAADPSAMMLSANLPLVWRPVEPRLTDVSAAAAQAERLLHSPVTVTGYDPITDERFSWEVPQETVRSWVAIEPGEAGPQVSLVESRVGDYLASLGESLGPERWFDPSAYRSQLARAVMSGDDPPSVIIKHHPTRYTVQPGDTLISIGWKVGMPYWMILEANPGLDEDSLWSGLELTIPSKDDLLPLPIVPGKRIVILIGEQRLRVYEGGELLSEHVISTGIDRSPTQPGVFQVQTHEIEAFASVWDLTMPHFLGIYEAWPGFMNGMHGLPTLSNGRQLWADILGRPASYGCIILDLEAAEWLYDWAENGVIVEIRE